MSGSAGPGFLAGVVLGALAGAVCGLLWAPRSGQENRDALLEKVPELRTHAPDALTRVTDEVKSRLHEGREAFREAAAETRQRMTQELEQTQRGEGTAP